MNIDTILKSLGISKLRALWAVLTGGVSGLIELIAQAFTSLLRKADPEKLKSYAELASKIAKLINFAVEMFVTSETYKKAGKLTTDALETLAAHVKDGEYTKEELDEDIDLISACIALWKDAAKCKKESK